MKENIQRYYKNNDTIALIKETIAINKKAFEDSIKGEREMLDKIENENSQLKDLIKENCIEEFELTKSKKLNFGFGIRVSNKLNYSNSDAISWAKENMPVALALDKKQFEVYAKTNDLKFVDKKESIVVTFPSVLKMDGFE